MKWREKAKDSFIYSPVEMSKANNGKYIFFFFSHENRVEWGENKLQKAPAVLKQLRPLRRGRSLDTWYMLSQATLGPKWYFQMHPHKLSDAASGYNNNIGATVT